MIFNIYLLLIFIFYHSPKRLINVYKYFRKRPACYFPIVYRNSFGASEHHLCLG